MSTDPATGLPELLEGYFWRIYVDFVEIRKSVAMGEWKESSHPGQRDTYGNLSAWLVVMAHGHRFEGIQGVPASKAPMLCVGFQ